MINNRKNCPLTTKAAVIAVACAMIVGCSHNQTSSPLVTESKSMLNFAEEEEAWKLMIGMWYGDQPTSDGGRKQWLRLQYPDGNYQIKFKSTGANGAISESVEVGQWAISGPIYFTSFRGWLREYGVDPSDPSDPYNYDAYRIIRLTSEVFEYEHFESGNRYTVEKVAPTFEFPD